MLRMALFVIAFVFQLGSAAMCENITINSPVDWQVFQRATKAGGKVLVEGFAPGAEVVDVRLDGKLLHLKVAKPNGSFSGKIEAKAGGWYTCDIQALSAGKVISQASVAHVGMGEVFIVAGQSNSTNYGSERQKPASGMVAAMDENGRWRPADDPQPGVHDRSTGGSFIPSFGDAVYEDLKVPVGVASVGHGATSVRQWLPKGSKIANHPSTDEFVVAEPSGGWRCDGQLFDWMMGFVHRLGPHGFRAILWHQGESDAGQARSGYPADRQITGAQYTELMKQLITATQKAANWKIPWFVAQATYHSEQDAADEEFRAAQKALWTSGIALQGPDTDALRAEYRENVHFNAKGQREHGIQWARKVDAWIAKR